MYYQTRNHNISNRMTRALVMLTFAKFSSKF